ncbi:hypothetical protein VPH35_027219 [Triticum aestivum]
MRRITTKHWGPYRRTGQTSGSGAGAGAVAVDRLSALPDALLHHIMSFLKAWEVVPTCVLARRWRHLWASAPCVDLRMRHSSVRDANPPEEFRDFVDSLFLHCDASASKDANSWIRTAVSRKARVIHLVGHRKGVASLGRVPFVSCHLKILKLSYARLDDRILGKLSSSCKSLEELDLKDCLVTGPKIVSTSLKKLIMLKCTFNWDFYITAPNLVLLRLITRSVRFPSFINFGSLVTGTIILDDSLLCDDFGYISDEDNFDETSDDDNHNDDKRENYKIHDDCSLSDDDFGYISDDNFGYISDDNPGYISDDGDFDEFGFGYGFSKGRYGHSRYKDNYDYGSDIDSDDNTYEYSEIANDAKYGYKGAKLSSEDGKYGGNSGRNYSKILGGQNMLESLSTATSLELLSDAGEVVLSRELKRCPTFSNLKTLSLGE